MLGHGSCHDRKMRPNGPCLVVGSTFGHLQTCRSSLATVPKQLESTKPQAAQLSTSLWDQSGWSSSSPAHCELLRQAVSCPRRASQASRSVSRLSITASLGLRLSCHRHPWHTAANGFTTSPEAPHVHLTELLKALLCSNLRLVHRAHARAAS